MICSNKYPLSNQFCMSQFGRYGMSASAVLQGSISCVDPDGTQGIEFKKVGAQNKHRFGTVAAYAKATGFTPDSSLKSSPQCREVFDYGWKSMEATKQKVYDLFNLRQFGSGMDGFGGGDGGLLPTL